MKMFLRFTAVATLLLTPTITQAQTAPANTGAAANLGGSPIVDSQWQFSTNGGASWAQAFQVQSPPSPPWQANTAQYSWISATSSASGGGGDYLFRTFFDLTGYDASSAAMTFRCAIDNYVGATGQSFQTALNGADAGSACGTGFQFGSTQSVTTGFVDGVNEVRFAVSGDSQTDGLLVGDMTLTANTATTATPEPASLMLLGTGFIGLAAVSRRRRTA